MSWWGGASQLTNFATSALKQAQKKIDKVLDIDEAASTGSSLPGADDDFFSSYLSTPQEKPKSSSPISSPPKASSNAAVKTPGLSLKLASKSSVQTQPSSTPSLDSDFKSKTKREKVQANAATSEKVLSNNLSSQKEQKLIVDDYEAATASGTEETKELSNWKNFDENESSLLGTESSSICSPIDGGEFEELELLASRKSEKKKANKGFETHTTNTGLLTVSQTDSEFLPIDGSVEINLSDEPKLANEFFEPSNQDETNVTQKPELSETSKTDLESKTMEILNENVILAKADNVQENVQQFGLLESGETKQQLEKGITDSVDNDIGLSTAETSTYEEFSDYVRNNEGSFVEPNDENTQEIKSLDSAVKLTHQSDSGLALESCSQVKQIASSASNVAARDVSASQAENKVEADEQVESSPEQTLQASGLSQSDLGSSQSTVLEADESFEDLETEVVAIPPEVPVTLTTSTSSSLSFVRCGAEDGSGSEPRSSPSDVSGSLPSVAGHRDSDEHSDLVKVDSCDETCTSSDIEVISNPSTAGEQRGIFLDATSPLRHAFLHSLSTRSDVSGEHEREIKDVVSVGESTTEADVQQQIASAKPTSAASQAAAEAQEAKPYAGEDCKEESSSLASESTLRDAEDDPLQPHRLLEKLAQVSEVLQAREAKLLDVSRANVALQENNAVLTNQLKQLEESADARLEDINQLTAEFTVRLSDQEKRLQQTIKDKDKYKSQLAKAEQDLLAKSGSSAQAAQLLKEKDEQIEELLHEGEKLSKEQLKSNTVIKKLRAGQKDAEEARAKLSQKLEKKVEELDKLKVVLDSKVNMEKAQNDAISQLNSAVKQQEKEIANLKNELEDCQERNRGLQTNLDCAYKEMSELRMEHVSRESLAAQAAISAEQEAREQARSMLEQAQQELLAEQELLKQQIAELQQSLSRQEKQHIRREQLLRQDVVDAQARLSEAESRNEELSQSVSAATRPLLRQLEHLQSTQSAQQSSWETLERGLTDRIGELQQQLSRATEAERESRDQLQERTARLAAIEGQVTSLRQERTQLSTELSMQQAQRQSLEDQQSRESNQAAAVLAGCQQEARQLQRDKLSLEGRVTVLTQELHQERSRAKELQEALSERERQLTQALTAPASPRILQRQESVGSEASTLSSSTYAQEDIMERVLGTAGGKSRASLYDSLRASGSTALLENLEAQLKQKDGEIAQLQADIRELERTRETLAREVVTLTNRLEEVETQLAQQPELLDKHKVLNGRYQALLQMYGEKVEQLDELRLDLHDVKEMYKSQIEQLLCRQ